MSLEMTCDRLSARLARLPSSLQSTSPGQSALHVFQLFQFRGGLEHAGKLQRLTTALDVVIGR